MECGVGTRLKQTEKRMRDSVQANDGSEYRQLSWH